MSVWEFLYIEDFALKVFSSDQCQMRESVIIHYKKLLWSLAHQKMQEQVLCHLMSELITLEFLLVV